MKREKIVLIGGGGHAKVVIDAILSAGVYDIIGLTDPELPKNSSVLGIPVIGGDEILSELKDKGVKYAFITIGSIGDCALRKELYKKIKSVGFEMPQIVHPSAIIAKDVVIGEGTFVAPSVTVNSGTVIGKNAILNTSSSIDHDCRIGDFVHVAPKVTLSGGVEVGDETHIGVGATVIQYKKIGKHCFVKAKVLVNEDMAEGDVFPEKKVDFHVLKREKVFIIAEAGVNHNGSLETAKRMIDAAKEAGADAVKFQSFKAENLVTREGAKAEYQKIGSDPKESQLDMLKRLELSESDHRELKNYCESKGIMFLSTAFDLESIGMLNGLGLEIFKIPSGEVTNLPYLRKIGGLSKKIIISTGMSSLEEVGEAIAILVKAGTPLRNITILHCSTEYPASYGDVNLRAMLTIRDAFRARVGYSDHTLGIEVAIAATALGAEVIEKHFTLDRNMDGPDHKSSLEPRELKAMVNAIRNIEKSLQGNGEKLPSDLEIKNKLAVRKSLVASCEIKKGELFTEENVVSKRPGAGISPMQWNKVVGMLAKRDFAKDEGIEL